MKLTDKRNIGIYRKFNVSRADGTDAPGGKHHGCEYFVLDLTHDPFALPAILAYARACEKEYPVLAKDLKSAVKSRRLMLKCGAALGRMHRNLGLDGGGR